MPEGGNHGTVLGPGAFIVPIAEHLEAERGTDGAHQPRAEPANQRNLTPAPAREFGIDEIVVDVHAFGGGIGSGGTWGGMGHRSSVYGGREGATSLRNSALRRPRVAPRR